MKTYVPALPLDKWIVEAQIHEQPTLVTVSVVTYYGARFACFSTLAAAKSHFGKTYQKGMKWKQERLLTRTQSVLP